MWNLANNAVPDKILQNAQHIIYFLYYIIKTDLMFLTLFSLEAPKRVISKQCRQEIRHHGMQHLIMVPLFANSLPIFL